MPFTLGDTINILYSYFSYLVILYKASPMHMSSFIKLIHQQNLSLYMYCINQSKQ